jgi:hypothetical protein
MARRRRPCPCPRWGCHPALGRTPGELLLALLLLALLLLAPLLLALLLLLLLLCSAVALRLAWPATSRWR